MRILLRLAIPLTLAQLINVLYNVVDRSYIGRLGGDSIDALTGLEEIALDGFSEEEKERLISYLKRVNDNLRK